MKKILLPFDGSQSAMRSLQHVVAAVKEIPQAEVHLLHVVDPSQLGTDESFWKGGTKEKLLADGERVLAPAKQALDQAGVPYQSDVTLGSPGNEIPSYARNHGCTSIVMGTRGMSPVASFFVGSVAHRVMQFADVPVTLVK
jgi:nucleotide-binding universal stress UspA family protein